MLLVDRELVPGGPSRMFPPFGTYEWGRPFRVSSPFSGLMALRSGESGPGGAFRLAAGTLSRTSGLPFRFPYLAQWPYGPGSPGRGVPFAFRRAPFPELSGLLSGPAQEIQVVLVPSLSLLG